MAERRMFAKTIIDSDMFLDMPLSTQALYFHLAMRADDDGFVNNPRKIQRMIGCGDDDLKLLMAKQFLLAFETGVVVIKHWKIHNYIRNDRYKPTIYQDELKQISENDNRAYDLAGIPDGIPNGIPNDNQMDTQVSIGKGSLVERSINNNDHGEKLAPDGAESEFEILWNLYPRKEGKQSAFKAYKKARKEGVSIETIEGGIERYKAHITASKIERRFIKQGSTWFNGRCWEDDYSTSDGQPPGDNEADMRKRWGDAANLV